MRLFKQLLEKIRSPFTSFFNKNRKRQFKLIANHGTDTEITEFKSTLSTAEGKTIKVFAWHGADKADLYELISGNWVHVFTYPQD